ncbi:MAG: MBOAT family protein [Bacteroidales bacterium]|nr:MBOAT family protein [Bacteroidales bacterium]
MVFSSNVFLLFFLPLFLVVYFAFPRKWRNYVVLLFSIVFYAYGGPDFVLILLASTTVTYYLVKSMCRTGSLRTKKWLCALAIVLNLGLLVYFKYAGFLMSNLNAVFSWFGSEKLSAITARLSAIVLPIGISFFTFQSITYVLDTYRGQVKPMDKLTDYIVYIMMFPQLIAGPIVKYGDVEQQLRHRESPPDECLHGFYRFVIGLSKKVLIADVIAVQADACFGGDLAALDMGTAWIGSLAYTMQLYFDFSGYSDMAIGLGRIMGFKFPENFNNPYTSKSITEFWRRWHMTLGAFIMNYLYIPLGGNRRGKGRTYLNLWICFLLSGLWHGAAWTFVAWGAFHGFFIVLEKMFKVKREHPSVLGAGLSTLLTFFLVNLGWVLFRADSISKAFDYYKAMFSFRCGSFSLDAGRQFYVVLAVAVLFAFLTLFPFGKKIEQAVFYKKYNVAGHVAAWVVAVLLLFFCVASLNATGFSPFIYFRF